MPDWSYRTLIRPLLYRLPAATARDYALEAMGTLARIPGGCTVIDLLGHLSPDARLRRVVGGIEFASPIGLGPALDVHARALPALERFGFGFLEVGPVSMFPLPREIANNPVFRDDDHEAFCFPSPPGLRKTPLLKQLQKDGAPQIPMIVRLSTPTDCDPSVMAEMQQLVMMSLVPFTRLFSTTALRPGRNFIWTQESWSTYVRELLGRLSHSVPNGSMFLCLPTERPAERSAPLVESALAAGMKGLIVDGAMERAGGEFEVGAPVHEPAVQLVRAMRSRFGAEVPIIAAGGVHRPRQALEFLDAGADLVEIDSGLVFSGPGLVKRANDAILRRDMLRTDRDAPVATIEPIRVVDSAWLWTLLLGVGLLIGGSLALAIASTRIVLPYDEMLTGLTPRHLAEINAQLLPFMAHDRVSVAGTMLAVGVFYCGLSWFGVRRGAHWAFVAIMASSFFGFCSFFSFLAFDYFDPFHAFVTTIMFQLQLMAVRGRLAPVAIPEVPDLDDDASWRIAQWGRLVWILHGCTLIGAGATILTIACSFVFVETDLDFLCTTAEALRSSHPRIVGLVAHDRAAFGGMLLSAGVTILLASLWGVARGRRWLWWTLVGGALPGYASALLVHFVVGYDDWFHLLPVSLGLAATILGSVLWRGYLCDAGSISER